MGEEQKDADSKEQEKIEETKEEEKKEEVPPEIVLRVDMHCAGCAKKVEKSVRKFEGVDDVKADHLAKRVVIKSKNADPVKICERVQRKSGRKVELISPLPNPPEDDKKEEAPQPAAEEKKESQPITVILKVRMHCEACAQVLQKRIKKMDGVESVVADFPNEQILVKGVFDAGVLVDNVYKKTRRKAFIVQDEDKKEEEKKEEEEKDAEKQEEKKEAENAEEAKKYDYWPSVYHVQYYDPPSQMFSDENPNACSVM